MKDKPYCYLVHGFNVRDNGGGTTDLLRPFAEEAGFRVKEFDYNWTWLLSVKLCDKKLARAFANLAEPGSVAIGHSNGCAIIHLAAQYGAPFSKLAYINPALNRDAELATQIKECSVWHSPGDKAVRAARLIPGSVWGKMGSSGYVGKDSRYRNYNKRDNFLLSSNTHSDVFSPKLLSFFGPKIIRSLT